MRSRQGLMAIPASIVFHGIGLLLAATLIRHEPAPSVIEIDLLPVMVNEEGKTSVPMTMARKGAPTLEARSRPSSIPSTPKLLETAPARMEGVLQAVIAQPFVTDLPVKDEHSSPHPVFPSPVSPPMEITAEAPPSTEGISRSLRDSRSGQGGGGALAMLSPGEGRTRSEGGSGRGEGGRGEIGLARSFDGDGRLLAEYDQFYALIRRHIQQALFYPASARRRELTGTVLLEIVLRSDGGIGRVEVLRSSRHQLLDDAAVETVKRAAPFSFLSALPARDLVVRIPIVFELTK